MTNEAPIPPIRIRHSRNVAKLWLNAIPITGNEPNNNRHVYVIRGPQTSQILPTMSLAMIVPATEPMMHQPTCAAVSAISSRTTFISGAIPNHEKKQMKKAIHAMWNARICGEEKFASSMRVALSVLFSNFIGGLLLNFVYGAADRLRRTRSSLRPIRKAPAMPMKEWHNYFFGKPKQIVTLAQPLNQNSAIHSGSSCLATKQYSTPVQGSADGT